jgi:hypothetical protein
MHTLRLEGNWRVALAAEADTEDVPEAVEDERADEVEDMVVRESR